MLTTPRTQLESDLLEKDASVIRAATALHHAAVILRAENDRFWSLPTERLLGVLNADIQRTLATFSANTTAGTAINALLDEEASPLLTARAPVTPGRSDIVFDGQSFVYVPPPEPEPQPEPEPES